MIYVTWLLTFVDITLVIIIIFFTFDLSGIGIALQTYYYTLPVIQNFGLKRKGNEHLYVHATLCPTS